MAFDLNRLSVLSYANGHTSWHYKHMPAQMSEVLVKGFFSNAHAMLSHGDTIMVSAQDGGAMFYVFHSNPGNIIVQMMSSSGQKDW